jgi:ring-1,2-phenylacetyl-CoA epoxidase subunit PaaC
VTGRPTAELPPVAQYALRLGDDALVLAQRLGEWAASAPELEEDVALTNIALDLLGQARALLTHAGKVEGAGRTEDDLAYLRTERDFVNVQLVEQPNGDFAQTIARQLFFSTYQALLYDRLSGSSDATIAGVAAKAVKEVDYHQDHAAGWTLRLGDGTDESHRRMQAGVDRMLPYTDELFHADQVEERLLADGIAVDTGALRDDWTKSVSAVLDEATLSMPEGSWTAPGGGRRGLLGWGHRGGRRGRRRTHRARATVDHRLDHDRRSPETRPSRHRPARAGQGRRGAR